MNTVLDKHLFIFAFFPWLCTSFLNCNTAAPQKNENENKALYSGLYCLLSENMALIFRLFITVARMYVRLGK